MKIGLNQATSLTDELMSNNWVKERFKVDDHEEVWDIISKISEPTRGYIWTNIYKRRYGSLGYLLKQIGIKKLIKGD